MQRNIWFRTFWTFATVAATGCGDDGQAPHYNDSYAPAGDGEQDDGAGDDDGEPGDGDGSDDGVPASDDASDDDGVVVSADVSLLSTSAFDGYLADADGRALYMFANDVPGSDTSACAGECLDKWPAFDKKELSVGEGLTAGDFTRFERADGKWQTSFKGHPLYYFAAEEGSEVGGDGLGGRWFVARDYFVFLGARPDLTPEGTGEVVPYLTNRAGRTSYVFMNDTVGSATSSPVSACVDGCLDMWPVWPAPPSLDDLILPSELTGSAFGELERTVAGATVKQLSYRGWPLYFYATDDLPGETSGHLTGAWRAIDPVSFADDGAASATLPGDRY